MSSCYIRGNKTNPFFSSEEFQYLVKHTVLHSQIPFDYGTEGLKGL